MNTTTERKMTGSLMAILFERKIIAESSVTGKGKEGRPPLDPEKVQLIICKFILALCYFARPVSRMLINSSNLVYRQSILFVKGDSSHIMG